MPEIEEACAFRFRSPPGADHWRTMGRRYVTFNIQTFLLRAPLYRGDIEMAVIGDVVGLHALGFRYGEAQTLPVDGCTVASIASATGLARETVRRKVHRLIELGYLMEAEVKGFALTPDILRTEPYWGAIPEVDRGILRMANGLLEDGDFFLEAVGSDAVRSPDHPPVAPVPLRLRPREGAERWRTLLRVFANFYVRMYRLRSVEHRDDFEMVILFDLIGYLSIDHLMQDERYRKSLASLAHVLGDTQRGCSLQRLVDSSGLPRETVRRKLKCLIEQGAVEQNGEGYIHRPGFLQDDAIWRVVGNIEIELLDFLNDCLAAGLYDIVAAPPT